MSTQVHFEGWTDEEVTSLLYQVGGAATRPLLEENPEYVFPAEKVYDAIEECLKLSGVGVYVYA